ncbi:hypothetical protein OF83DRAFT_1168353 [Amylostereum chailletii]|nr:hypothetical protein OF83DRAFT_1168353 [Amylostereum chailletii]
MGSVTDDTQANLEPYFEKTANRVRYVFGRVEENYARPFFSLFTAMFVKYPISTTFVSIFAALSIVPAVSFVTMLFATLATTLAVGIFLALVAYAVVFMLAAGVLLAILTVVFFLSAFLTFVIVGLYLSVRLYSLVRASGRAGVSVWAEETKNTFSRSQPSPDPDDHGTSGSEASAFTKLEHSDTAVEEGDTSANATVR